MGRANIVYPIMPRTMWTVAHSLLTGAELFVLEEDGADIVLRGWVVAAVEGVGCAVSYEIVANDRWSTRRVEVTLDSDTSQTMTLEHDGAGNWSVDGGARPDLSTCLDVDLGISPATNTLPIRRLELEVGEARRIGAVWVRFPALSVEVLSQTYERRSDTVYRYSSDGFQRDLEVDERGVVQHYGDDLWQAMSV